MNPKVFISHASEDKERFVLNFAKKLRDKGIDAWLDKWEMLPGDSLVEKIFEGGIKNANAIIVILSSISVSKPWVKEELNVSFANHVNKVSKLIPVIIDECKIPECLNNTVWQRIKDLDNYDEDLKRIVMAIYGDKSKPPLGKSPKYTKTVVDQVGNLTNLDNIVMKIAFDIALEKNTKVIKTVEVSTRCSELDISKEELLESLNLLDETNYIDLRKTTGSTLPPLFIITDSGFEDCSRTFIGNYKKIYESVTYQVVNISRLHSSSISEKLSEKSVIVENILKHLHNRGLIKTVSMNTGILVSSVSTGLKRALKSRNFKQ